MTSGEALVDAPDILVVEDDPDFSCLLCDVLRRSGGVPRAVPDGLQAVQAAQDHRPDLVLLDLGLPRVDGSSLVRLFRYELDLPVMVVSGRSSPSDVVANLDGGADDYLVKPVRSDVLVARVRAVLRRLDGSAAADTKVPPAAEVLTFGDLEIDRGAKQVRRAGEIIRLTPRELDLLVHLASHPGVTMHRRDILAAVWDATPATSASSTVNEHIRRLRNKVEIDPRRPRWIVTEPGFGYRFQP